MNRHTLQRFGPVVLLAFIAVMMGPRSAFAHTGVGLAHDLLHGFAHPLTGLDHLLAMFAVGLWAAQRGGPALWVVPFVFVFVMPFGVILGISGVSIPFVEPGIAISSLVMGVFVAAALRWPLSISAAIVALFALLHGHAHGAEIPASASGLTYALGFISATILLHATGICFGLLMQRVHSSQLVRYAGTAIILCGVLIYIS